MISTCASLSKESREGMSIRLWPMVRMGGISSAAVLQSIVLCAVAWTKGCRTHLHPRVSHKLPRLVYTDRLLYVCSHVSYNITCNLQIQEIKCWNALPEDQLDLLKTGSCVLALHNPRNTIWLGRTGLEPAVPRIRMKVHWPNSVEEILAGL